MFLLRDEFLVRLASALDIVESHKGVGKMCVL
jgi:hypothetical protein